MMQESASTKVIRFFKKNNVIFRSIFLIFLIGATVYSFFQEDMLLRILILITIGTSVASIVSNYVFNYLYGEGYKLAYVFNEILYLFVGIPFLLITIGYFPLSVYILFVDIEDTTRIFPILLAIMITLQVLSFIYILRQRGKEKGKTIIQLVSYLFNFKARAEEQRKYRKQEEKISDFYSRMGKVNENLSTRMEESVVDFRNNR